MTAEVINLVVERELRALAERVADLRRQLNVVIERGGADAEQRKTAIVQDLLDIRDRARALS